MADKKPWELEWTGDAEAVPPARSASVMGPLPSEEDPGALGALTLSAGRETDRIVQGAKHLALSAQRKYYESHGNKAEVARLDKEIARIAADQQEKSAQFEPVKEMRPTASGFGGALPYAIPTGGILPSALIGGAAGFTAYEPSVQERLLGAGKQGVLSGTGAALGGALSGVASPGQRVMDRGVLTGSTGANLDRLRGFQNPDASGQILARAEGMGYTPYLSEISRGPRTAANPSFVGQAEDYLARAPGSSGVMADFAGANQRAFNTAAAGSIGERARNLSAEVLAKADERVGKTFEAVAALPGNPVSLGADVGQAAAEVSRKLRLRPLSADPKLAELASTLQTYAAGNGRLTGEAYNALRSDISAAANSAYRSGNGPVGHLYGEILDALDSSAITSLQRAGQGDLASQLVKARTEYANLSSLERGRTVTAGGDVSPQALSGVMRQKYGKKYKEGGLEGNALNDIARFGETYPPLRSGSQTLERQTLWNAAEAPAEVAMQGGGSGGTSLVGLATMPVNYMAAQYMTSPIARYLARRGVLGEPTLSHFGGVLSDVGARDFVSGLPLTAGIFSGEQP